MYLVLASKSPRRREILTQAGYNIKLDVSNVDETVPETNPVEKVMAIAKKKGLAVFSKYSDANAVILSADTIVVINDEILGKPKDKDDARRMITMLQGNSHHVYTGVFIQSVYGQDSFYDETTVNIKSMSEEEIENYINTPEPYDKAGAYAIQGIFSKYISNINGDYYNVMGLPINKVSEVLKKYNFNTNDQGLTEEVPNVKICSRCGNSNKEGSKYCSYCGSLLVTDNNPIQVEGECPICHHINKKESSYCEICGTILGCNNVNNFKDGNYHPNYINGNNNPKVVTKKDANMSMTGLVLGIITVCLDITCLGCIMAFVTGILAIVFSSISLKHDRNSKTIAGLILGIVGEVLSILILVIMIFSGTFN